MPEYGQQATRITPGRRRSRPGRVTRIRSLAHTGLQPITAELLATRITRGLRRCRPGRITRIASRAVEYVRRYATHAGQYRIFNGAEYRLYRSQSGPPSITDTPFATVSALPTTPTDTFADGTWYISVSYFNGIQDSGFLPIGPNGETYLRLDIDGDIADTPPEGPNEWRLAARASGVIRIIANYTKPALNRAEQWAIAYTTNGSEPAEDTPDYTYDIPPAGLAILNYDLPAQANATNVKVRLQTRINIGTILTPVWLYSEDSEVKTLAADAVGPTAPLTAEAWPGRPPEELT